MELERRTVLQVSGAVAVGGLLAACGSSTSATSESAGGSAAAGSGGTVKAADVPVGGGIVVADPAVVVTQPKAGEYKAFSSTCTHQGCAVASVADNVITCPCHGSQFSAADGSVIKGPATSPLPAKTVSVSGGDLTVT